MSGPPRKPTSLKKLFGNPGNQKLPEGEPTPSIETPSCPAHLSKAAKAEWKRITPELEKLGLLAQVDRSSLAAYCQEYGRWVDTEKAIAEIREKLAKEGKADFGGVIYTTKNGNMIINPLLSVSHRSLELMHKFMVEFGMSPAARTRINVEKQGTGDAMEDLLNNPVRKN